MHGFGSGKGNRQGACYVEKKSAGQTAADVGYVFAMATRGSRYARRMRRHGLAMSYFLLCRASELWAYANGQVHLEFCLTRNCFVFCHEGIQVAFENRSAASTVQVSCLASTSGQKRAGCTITRTRLKNRVGDGARADRSFRSLVGTARRAPSATRGGAIEDEEHVGRMESVY